jgi:hypothetical protein
MSAADSGVLDADRGLLSLAAAGRKGLNSDLVLTHSQQVLGGMDVLVGPRVPEQAAGLTNLWPMLGPALDGIPGYDVIADCGRIGADTPQNVLLRASRLLVLVCTVEPSSVVHLRERLTTLAPMLDPSSPVGTPIAVVVVADPKARDAVAQARQSLERTEIPLQGVWHLAYDPKGAGFFKGHVVGRADKTMLVKTARPAVEQVAALVEPFFEPLDDQSSDDDADVGEWGDFSFVESASAPVDATDDGDAADVTTDRQVARERAAGGPR